MNSTVPKRISPRPDDAALIKAVAQGLRRFIDGGNQDGMRLTQKQLAGRLGVSPAMINNLLRLLDHSENGSEGQRDLSGQLLLRALREGIPINYGELEFVAVSSKPQQIAFTFDGGLPCEETAEGITVRVEKKGPASTGLRVQIKVAG
jgi:hypothetical protein